MKNFFKIDENKLINIFFTFCLIVLILFTVMLLTINYQIETVNDKIQKSKIEKKDKTIKCIKKQLYCYNENRKLTEKEIIKSCGNIDFCENN